MELVMPLWCLQLTFTLQCALPQACLVSQGYLESFHMLRAHRWTSNTRKSRGTSWQSRTPSSLLHRHEMSRYFFLARAWLLILSSSFSLPSSPSHLVHRHSPSFQPLRLVFHLSLSFSRHFLLPSGSASRRFWYLLAISAPFELILEKDYSKCSLTRFNWRSR